MASRRYCRGRRIGRIDVTMRIDPEHTDPFTGAMGRVADAGDRADRDRMIAAEHERKAALVHDPFDLAGEQSRRAAISAR